MAGRSSLKWTLLSTKVSPVGIMSGQFPMFRFSSWERSVERAYSAYKLKRCIRSGWIRCYVNRGDKRAEWKIGGRFTSSRR